MIELSLRERFAGGGDGLFLERLDAFMEKCLADIRAFAERESRSFEETRQYVAEWHGKYIFQSREATYLELPSRVDRIRTTLYDASRILESLSETAGVQSFLLAVDPVDPTDCGFLGGSLTGREFWRRMRNGGEAGARAFRTYCIKDLPAAWHVSELGSSADISGVGEQPRLPPPHETTARKSTAKNLKSELYERIRTALRNVSGIRSAEMKWTNPERLDTYGVRLVGWPSDIPAQNPSSLKQGQNKQLLQGLDNRTLRFEKIIETESQDDVLEGTVEDAAGLEEDFSWAYDADAEIVPNTAEESGTSLAWSELTQPNSTMGSQYGSTLSSPREDPQFPFPYMKSEMCLDAGEQDQPIQPPPIKRARTEE
ncbi:hypothetical protein AX15_004591 [Amanita polypyramis BW_CC]|nr:hypothetical protein AX15_004591 [Amanita polypyramis BW_CC]